MKKLLLSLLATFALATTAGAASLTQTIDKTFDVKPGARFVLSNVNGRIAVHAWDQPRIRVIAEKRVEGSKDVIEAAMKELHVDMQPRDGGLVVTTRQPKSNDGWGAFFDLFTGDHVQANVRYDITVPRTMNVYVDNTNGAISLTEVSGSHDLSTTNGRIEVERCSGSLQASTTNGSIEAELLRVARNEKLELETTNGRIEVAVPADFAGDVDADTTNGSIHTDLPVTTRSVSKNSLRGTVNGGGVPLKLRTTNGGITIRVTN